MGELKLSLYHVLLISIYSCILGLFMKMFIRTLVRSGNILARPSAYNVVKISAALESTSAPEIPNSFPKFPPEGPERDHKNFPRLSQPYLPTPVRLLVIPQNWFDAFYEKTGVTGPYMLVLGSTAFLLSKEYWVVEHELASGVVLFAVWGMALMKFGPKVFPKMEQNFAEAKKELDDVRDIPMNEIKGSLVDIDTSIDQAKHQHLLYEAKRENVLMQLEAGYRQRLLDAHRQVKQKLDYHLQTNMVKDNFEHKHMVNWIVSGVRSSITPAQETAALKQCLVDLKALAARS